MVILQLKLNALGYSQQDAQNLYPQLGQMEFGLTVITTRPHLGQNGKPVS